MRTPSADMEARCAEYVALMERGHTILEVAQRYAVQRNAVHGALLARGLPNSMKEAVRAYWKRQDGLMGRLVAIQQAATAGAP